MSSVAEPVQVWLKYFSVIESSVESFDQKMPRVRAAMAMQNNVTPSILLEELPHWCQPVHYAVHESQLPSQLVHMLHAAMPWVVCTNPERYPFFTHPEGSHQPLLHLASG